MFTSKTSCGEEMNKQQMLENAPKFCKWCKENDDIEWTEFVATFGEKVYVDNGKIVGMPLGESFSCECTRCGVRYEEKKD